MRSVPLVAAFVLALVVIVAGGQAPPFRSGVETVHVTVTVVDASNRLITGLTKDDFQVYEDGQAQPITNFSDQRVPVSLGVLLDVSDSMFGQPIVDARGSFDRFVGDLLEPEDEAFLAAFNH